VDGCRLDDLVDVIREGGPMHEGLKISHRIVPRSCFVNTVGSIGTEFCVSIIRKREIWEAGLHCVSLGIGNGWRCTSGASLSQTRRATAPLKSSQSQNHCIMIYDNGSTTTQEPVANWLQLPISIA